MASIAKGGATGIQTATEFSADSKWLAVSRNGKVTIFDTEQFESVYEVNGSGLLYVSFSEDGKRVVVAEGGKSGFVKLVSCGDWEVLFEGSETKAERTSVNLLKGGKEIYFGLEDNRMEVWNWKAME